MKNITYASHNSYSTYVHKLFRGTDGEHYIIGRLASGACTGMTSTFVILVLIILYSCPLFL